MSALIPKAILCSPPPIEERIMPEKNYTIGCCSFDYTLFYSAKKAKIKISIGGYLEMLTNCLFVQ